MKKTSFLFPQHLDFKAASALLLLARWAFGGLLASHGLHKLQHFQEMADGFIDFMGLGSSLSLCLAIFAELICSVGLMVGLLTRLALIPMMITMGVAFWHTHGGDLQGGELALIYLLVFVLLFLSGPGKYSIDYLIGRR